MKILELSGTAFNQKIDLSKIDSKDRQLVEKLKKSAIVALLDSLVQARLSYNSIIDTDRAFKREFENFKSLWKSIGAWDITPALDFESGRSRKRGFSQPAASIHNMKFYLEFSRLIKAETGNYPLLYTAPFARSAFMNGAKSAAEYTEIGLKYWLWWAEYDRTSGRTKADAQGGRRYPTWKPWSGYDIWQFSGWGRFESLGGQGRFDFNSMKKSSLPKIKWGASATPSGFSGTT